LSPSEIYGDKREQETPTVSCRRPVAAADGYRQSRRVLVENVVAGGDLSSAPDRKAILSLPPAVFYYPTLLRLPAKRSICQQPCCHRDTVRENDVGEKRETHSWGSAVHTVGVNGVICPCMKHEQICLSMKSGTYQLPGGRTVRLRHLSVARTYGGLLTGSLNTGSKMVLDALHQQARNVQPYQPPLW
jgi:hypothetical protein